MAVCRWYGCVETRRFHETFVRRTSSSSNRVQSADISVEQRQSDSPRSGCLPRHLDSLVVLLHGLYGYHYGFRTHLDGHAVFLRWLGALPRCCPGMVRFCRYCPKRRYLLIFHWLQVDRQYVPIRGVWSVRRLLLVVCVFNRPEEPSGDVSGSCVSLHGTMGSLALTFLLRVIGRCSITMA
jgi:hypothetical protein